MLDDAREKIEEWRVDYNTKHPHRSLKQLTPYEYKEKIEAKRQEQRLELSVGMA